MLTFPAERLSGSQKPTLDENLPSSPTTPPLRPTFSALTCTGSLFLLRATKGENLFGEEAP
jgi:hypothetical protein